ncbi:MAG: ATP-binding protein [bacterium]
MEHQYNHNQLKWFIPLRLATFVILFTVVSWWMKFPGFLILPFILYSVFTLSFTVILAFDKKKRLQDVSLIITILHFIFEIIIESGIIYSTGNINSPFSALFILTIVSAALAFRLMGTLIVASGVSLVYAFIIWLGLSNITDLVPTQEALKTVFNVQEDVFYSIFMHILIFYLTAFISGYLAEHLKLRDKQLADTSLALKQAKLETDDILRHLNSGLLTIDPQGRIIFFNSAAEKILGYREQDVRGLHCKDVFAERMPNLASSLVEGIDLRIAQMRQELNIINKNGIQVPIGLSISILKEKNHSLRGVIAIFSDISDAKMMEAKVRASDRLSAAGELSASMAHEIRNPLAAISGSVEVLQSELVVTGENAKLMELIVKESHRLSRILSEFLCYARIDRAAYDKVDLYHVINDTIQVLHHQESYNDNITVKFEADESIKYVVGDEDLIKQLLINLAINSCEAFEGNGGVIIFKLVNDDDCSRVNLLVVDNGPGISAENIKKIYQPFFSTKKNGTGLGLAIVHRICAALKTSLSIESEIGNGTTFQVQFRIFKADRFENKTANFTHQSSVTS